MAKIVKSTDAPEGDVKVSVGAVHFVVGTRKGYDTDDYAVIEAAQAIPYLEVKYDKKEVAQAEDAQAQMEAVQDLHDAQEAAQIQHAEKDPLEPAAEVPLTVEDLDTKKRSK